MASEDSKQGCEEQRMCEGRLGMMWKIISSCAGFHTGPLLSVVKDWVQ